MLMHYRKTMLCHNVVSSLPGISYLRRSAPHVAAQDEFSRLIRKLLGHLVGNGNVTQRGQVG